MDPNSRETVIEIDGSIEKESSIEKLAKLLCPSPAVEKSGATTICTLSLRNVALRAEHFPPSAGCVNLEVLILHNVRLTTAVARQAQRLLFTSPSRLVKLECDNNPKLGPRGLPILLQCCSAKNTTSLGLRNIGLGPFCQPPNRLPTTLQSLDLAGNNLGNAALYKWQQPLSSCRSLSVLDVSDNDLGDDGMRALAGVFPTLLRLTASGNGITTLGGTRAPKLEYLDLRRNHVGDSGITDLVASWKEISVNIEGSTNSDTNIEPDEADNDDENWESLSPIPLQTLLLSHNKVESSGSKILAQGVRSRAPKLETIDLAHNAMDDAGADAWLDAVDDLPALRVLDVTPCRNQVLQLLLNHRNRATARADSNRAIDVNEDDCLDEDIKNELWEALKYERVTDISSSVINAITKDFSIPAESKGAFGTRYLLSSKITPPGKWHIRRCQSSFEFRLLEDLHGHSHPYLVPIVAYNLEMTSVLYSYGGFQTVRDLLQGSRRLAPTRVHSLITCVAEALAFLHDHGYYHGDVQSQTVVISLSGPDVAQLTDAGLGSQQNQGTVGYRCPRFERGSVAYSTASDIFSLGIVCAELVTGKLQNSPISGSSVAWDALFDLPQHPSLLVGVSPEVRKLIASCMTSNVEQRPTADTVVEWLT